MQAHLQNDGLERSHASNDFEEHGSEKVCKETPFLHPDVDIIPVQPFKADIPFLIGEGGVETTKIVGF
jgi:hypothetical protein